VAGDDVQKPVISTFRKSTSAGKSPPAEAWPVIASGRMVTYRTSRM
jgi:hypothetical protein